MTYSTDKHYALERDKNDSLNHFRHQFHFPEINGQEAIYLCGNSLGLQPRNTEAKVGEILQQWKNMAVEGHFEGDEPWVKYHEKLKAPMSEIVGAKPSEIAVMNSLTVNLHLLMISFYRPKKDRYKIIMEKDAFPSDKYVIESQLEFHGYDKRDAIIYIEPDANELMTEEGIIDIIKVHGHETALVLLGGVNYYTGQFLNVDPIVSAAKSEGCTVGFDMAHAAGNLPLKLHNDEVDFAAWCTYKYLNAGPGNLSACFIHEKHHNASLPRFTGWWGHDLETRFKMDGNFVPEAGAEGWVLSNPPVMALAAIMASLELFDNAGIENLRHKSISLTGYLECLINQLKNPNIRIITPQDQERRGAQLSIQVKNADKSLFYKLKEKGIITDWREPDVIRVSPAPIYNSYLDVWKFADLLGRALS